MDQLDRSRCARMSVPARSTSDVCRARLRGLTHETAADTHRDRLFDSCLTTPAGRTNVRALASALTTGRFGVLRAKGTPIDDQGADVSLQIVGARWSWSVQPSQPASDTDLVCIGLPTISMRPASQPPLRRIGARKRTKATPGLLSQGSASVS